jgi:hypothetical protein
MKVDVLLERDAAGHLACTLVDRDATATVIAPDFDDAAADLEAALADARDRDYAECVWQLADGEYKWLFRRSGDRIDVALVWSAGVVTGWQHVFRGATDASEFEARVLGQLARLRHEPL